MKAVILAGGFGTRLAPYTTILPKPLLPIGNKAILHIVVKQLANYGFEELNLSVGYLSELIMAYFGDGSKFGIKLNYIHEDKPLGTAGALTKVKGLDDTFLLMNGDVLTTLDYAKLIRFHKKNRAAATVTVCSRTVKLEFGMIEKDKKDRLIGYIEKPSFDHLVSIGVNILEPRVLDYLEPDKKQDFPDLIKKLAQNGERVFCYTNTAYWMDIGRAADYQQAQADFSKMEKVFLRKPKR